MCDLNDFSNDNTVKQSFPFSPKNGNRILSPPSPPPIPTKCECDKETCEKCEYCASVFFNEIPTLTCSDDEEDTKECCDKSECCSTNDKNVSLSSDLSMNTIDASMNNLIIDTSANSMGEEVDLSNNIPIKSPSCKGGNYCALM